MNDEKCIICGGFHGGLACPETRVTCDRPAPETDALCERLTPLLEQMTADNASLILTEIMTKTLVLTTKLERELHELRAELDRAETKTAAEYEAHKMTQCERDALKSEVESLKVDKARLESHLKESGFEIFGALLEATKADK